MPTLTPRDIIDTARVRHWAFADVNVGDGALVLFLNQRLRTHVALHGETMDGLMSASVQYAIPLRTQLVTLINGVPYLTAGDGYAMHNTATPYATYQQGYGATLVLGVPTIDVAAGVISADPFGQQFADATIGPFIDPFELPLAIDPFGSVGGTPGFPLPVDMVRMVSVNLIYQNVPTLIPCTIMRQQNRLRTLPGRDPAVFVSGNRLIPLYQTPTFPTADRWANVSAIQVTYVPLPRVRTLAEFLTLPAVLCEVLIADTVVMLAQQSPKVTPADKAAFVAAAAKSAAEMDDAALGMLNDSEIETVDYRG